MTSLDPYLLVRAASIYLALVLTVAVWFWRWPRQEAVAGAVMASVWNLPLVLLLNVVAQRRGWWRFDARGGLLLGVPLELYLSWVWLWGALPALAFPSTPVVVVAALAFVADLILMPASLPVIRLGHGWLIGEAIGLALCLVPGLLLARWTTDRQQLPKRAMLQVIAFAGFVVFVLPAIAIDGSGTGWLPPTERPLWQLSLIAQVLFLPLLMGLSAVQEFVTHGSGTPVPFDPPRRLVTTGVYAYVRNPMQLSALLLLLCLGVVLGNLWISAAGLMTHLYSIGFAAWDEDEDLQRRFGSEWIVYRTAVRSWLPRLRPWRKPGIPSGRLYVAGTCETCRGVAEWFERRDPIGLVILPAESHASRALTRITYEGGATRETVSGVIAVGRALEHIHLGWALVGMLFRLPGISALIQLVVDGSGGEPRPIAAPHTTAATASTRAARR
jgi:protein-S-isoprenylcysteine O-methyltransferase Ste14